MAYKERKQFAMVHGGMKCIKYLLFGFNLLFFLIGLGLIITGAAVQTKFSDISRIIGNAAYFWLGQSEYKMRSIQNQLHIQPKYPHWSNRTIFGENSIVEFYRRSANFHA